MTIIAIAISSTEYIPLLYAEDMEQAKQTCEHLKQTDDSEIYTIISPADPTLDLKHVKDYNWED